MGTSLEKLAEEAEQIIAKYGVKNKPENAVLMSEEEYFKLVKYAHTGIPERPKNWTPNLWDKFYYTVTDVIFYRNSKLGREDLTKEEKRVLCFEVATRPKEWDEYALAKDIWFSRVTGKKTDMSPEAANKWATEFVRKMRDEGDY